MLDKGYGYGRFFALVCGMGEKGGGLGRDTGGKEGGKKGTSPRSPEIPSSTKTSRSAMYMRDDKGVMALGW